MITVNSNESFMKVNDVSNSNFNPVINKITTFMEKKEKKNSDHSRNA